MKNIKSFDLFVNEEINWNKQPWKLLKNIMKLEEPDYEEENTDVKADKIVKDMKKKLTNKQKESPNDIVTMTTGFQLSLLGVDTEDSVTKAIEVLAKRHNLTGTVSHRGLMEFSLEFKGKRKNADSFYDELKNIIRN